VVLRMSDVVKARDMVKVSFSVFQRFSKYFVGELTSPRDDNSVT